MTRMDDTMHTSYSFFPSSAIKKEVPLKFYQRPLTNYKLECDQQEERSLRLLVQNHSILDVMSRASSIAKVLWNVNAMSISSLVVLLVVPIASGHCTPICTPMALISVGGMYIALVTWLDDAIDDLAQMAPGFKQPTWFNLCQSAYELPITKRRWALRNQVDEQQEPCKLSSIILFRLKVNQNFEQTLFSFSNKYRNPCKEPYIQYLLDFAELFFNLIAC